MTDEQMDARLRAAGERWRAGAATAEPHPDDGFELLPARTRSHNRRWLAVASAAVLVAVLALAGMVVAQRTDHAPSSTNATRQLSGKWIDPVTRATLTFAPGSVRIADGCSTGTYRLQVAGNRATVGAPIGNVSVCGGTPENQDRLQLFHQVVSGTFTFVRSGQLLALSHAGAGTVLLTPDGNLTLVDTDWHLWKITDRDGTNIVPAGDPVLHIDGEQHLTGTDGCNSLSGDVQVRVDTIVVPTLATTEMACVDPAFSGSTNQIDAMLADTVHYSIDGDALTLTKPGAGTLVYRAASADGTDLVGRAWTLTGTEKQSGGSSTGASAAGESVVRFDGQGGFTLEHRCYVRQGEAQVASGTVTLSNVRLKSAHPCPYTGTQDQEQRENELVDSVLTGTVSWSLDGNRLTISNGGTTLTFEAAPAIVGPTWTLTTIEKGVGPYGSASPPSAAVPFTFTDAHVSVPYLGADVTISPGRITFGYWTDDQVAGPARLDTADSAFVYRHVLVGTVTWAISGNQLTISKDGVGALVFTKS
jgi:heat shock protein HslJ